LRAEAIFQWCRAFTTTARNSEAVIGVAVSAFPGHPLVYLAIILGPIVELPMLLVIARMMLVLRDRIGARPAVGHDQA
jgi:ACR3 family arsenite transporter